MKNKKKLRRKKIQDTINLQREFRSNPRTPWIGSQGSVELLAMMSIMLTRNRRKRMG